MEIYRNGIKYAEPEAALGLPLRLQTRQSRSGPEAFDTRYNPRQDEDAAWADFDQAGLRASL